MITEVALVESAALRAGYTSKTEVLDKVGSLALLPDGVHADRAAVASFYDVPADTIRTVCDRHRGELQENGMRTLTSKAELERHLDASIQLGRGRPNMVIFPKRAILNVGMLLRDSEVAKRVRTYLLDAEETLDASEIKQLLQGMEQRITSQFQPRTISAVADEARFGSQPLGSFMTAIAEEFGLQRKNDATAFVAELGAVRRVRAGTSWRHYVAPGWFDVLEDTYTATAKTPAPSGTVRVRNGQQSKFMQRLRDAHSQKREAA